MSRNKRNKITNASRAGETAKSRGMVYADGKTIKVDASGKMKVIATDPPVTPGSDGTVTSVGLSASPSSVFNVSGSPVTTSGTLALSLDDQAANKVLAGPATGADATPSFRSLVTADISNDMITLPKIDNIADQRLLGNDSGGSASPQEIAVGTDLEFTGSQAVRHKDTSIGATVISTPQSLEWNARGHIIDYEEDPFYNGEGRVFGRSSTARAITTGSLIYYAESIDRFYIGTAAANGVLHAVDMIIKESYVLATYTGKTLTNAIYSPTSGYLYLGYGATLTQSVNATTGAAVTTGIAAGITLGVAIRPSDGVLYGGNSGSGDINRINSASDTAGTAIVLTKPMNSNSRKAVAYCDDNDSIYTLGGSGATVGINRIDCTTNTEAASFTLAALSGGSGAGSCVWSAYAGKIFAADGNVSGLSQIDPSSDTQEAGYVFPPGVAAGIGSNGMVCLGRYLYLGCHSASTPNEILVFDTLELEFIGSLNTANGATTDGRCMSGKAGSGIDDTFLLAGTSGVAATNWFYFGGRL